MDIIVVGAHKAGTTWLFSMLRQHPGVGFAFNKEVHYFDQFDKPGFDPAKRIDNLLRRKKAHLKYKTRSQKAYFDFVMNPNTAFSDSWYEKIFTDKPENRIKKRQHGSISYCDITPSYSAMSEKGVARLAALLPSIVPVLVVRDPVRRMISAHSMSLHRKPDQNNGDPKRQVSELRDKHVARGDYARMIPLFRKYFSELMIIPFGQIHSDPQSVMRQIEKKYGLVSIQYKGMKVKRNSHTGKVNLQPEVLGEIERLCAPQYDYLAREFGQGFLSII